MSSMFADPTAARLASPLTESGAGPSKPVRVRYAPSPTGVPHIGNIRTALFCWLTARHTGGTFILRIEDTDQSRLVKGAFEAILESLRWLGLDWDEGPDVGGEYGPYIQSQRLGIYRDITDQLIASGHAYRCYCSAERLAELRSAQMAGKEAVRYDRRCRDLSPEEGRSHQLSGKPSVVRFKIPLDGKTSFRDLFRGEIAFDNSTLDDHVLLKSDGWPTYHLACTVDDHMMEISHVLRGEEWISSAPRHILLYQALGWAPPLIGHTPLILGKDRTKLSKRHGATDVLYYRQAGYLPEALINFLALLGWAPSDGRTEILSREELVQQFEIERIGVNPAIFDPDKLDWMNGYYIRQISVEDLANRVIPFLQEAGLLVPGKPDSVSVTRAHQIVPLIQERLKRLSDAPETIRFFLEQEVKYDPDLLFQKGMAVGQARPALVLARERLTALAEFDAEQLEIALRALATELGLKTRHLFGMLRVATTGRTVAPPLFETMAVLGRDASLSRIDVAIDLLRGRETE